MHKRKVLFFASSFTKDVPRGLRFQKIVKYLEKNYDIYILAFNYNLAQKKSSAYTLHTIEHNILSKVFNKNIFFPNLAGTIRGKLLGVITYLLSKFLFPDAMIIEKEKIIKEIIALHKKYDFEFIVNVAMPYTSFIIGKELKERGLKFKLIVDIGDPFAENSARDFSRKVKEKVESYEEDTLSYADALVVTNTITKRMYKEKYPKLSEKEIAVIPQGTDNVIYVNKNSKSNNSIFTLVYAGIFYPKLREPYALFNAIAQWEEECILNIYGMQNIYNLENNKIHFKGRVSHKKVIDAYKNADILVFIDNAFGLQSSGKIFELLAMQKPILFISDHPSSPTKELMGEHNFVFFTKNSPENIEQALQNIKENRKEFVFDFDINSVNWKQRAEAYAKLFEKVSDNRKIV